MFKAVVIFLALASYQFAGVAGLHNLPVVNADQYRASCVFLADLAGSEKMRESALCRGA